MIKFGISWVARLLGVSGFTVQQPTTRGSLQDLNISAKVVPFNPDNLAKDNFHFNIGNILLYIPYFKFLEKFYFFYFPLMLCSIFIYTITKLIDRKNFLNVVLLILIVFSPQVLLVLERCNVDLIIFLFQTYLQIYL